MTGAGDREAQRLRLCRESFERALADGVTVPEARARLARERWAAADDRLRQRRCGTIAAPTPMLTPDEDGERPLQWWQR